MIENFFVCVYAFIIVMGCMSTYAAITGKKNHLTTWKARRTQSALALVMPRTVVILYSILAAAFYAGDLDNLGTLMIIGGVITILQVGIIRPHAQKWIDELDSVEQMFKSLKA